MVQAWGRPALGGERDPELSACLVGRSVWREMQTVNMQLRIRMKTAPSVSLLPNRNREETDGEKSYFSSCSEFLDFWIKVCIHNIAGLCLQ